MAGAGACLSASIRGVTPLHAAAGAGMTSAADLLLDYGVSVHTRNNRGATALMIAAEAGHADTVGTLIERGRRSQRQGYRTGGRAHESG